MPDKKRPELWSTWKHMIARCHSPNRKDYPHYGGRGVTVCERWRRSYSTFAADMGPRPSAEHSIDRIDTAKGYEPGNCRWATAIEQQRNRSNNVLYTIGSESLTAAAWAERVGLPKQLVDCRVRSGWSIQDALAPRVGRRAPSPDVAPEAKERRARRAEYARRKYAEQKASGRGRAA